MSANYRCGECDAPLINTKNFSSCPNGHGKLRNKLPRDIACRNAALFLGVAQATQLRNGLFTIPGREGYYEAGRAVTRELCVDDLRNGVYAFCDGKVRPMTKAKRGY